MRRLFVCAGLFSGLLLANPAAAAGITTPKEHFGFNIGDDYCLANYQELTAYWEKLERESLSLIHI